MARQARHVTYAGDPRDIFRAGSRPVQAPGPQVGPATLTYVNEHGEDDRQHEAGFAASSPAEGNGLNFPVGSRASQESFREPAGPYGRGESPVRALAAPADPRFTRCAPSRREQVTDAGPAR